MSKYITQSTVVEKIDTETGEVSQVETSKTFRVKVSPKKFFMTFIDAISVIRGIKYLSDRIVLDCMCQLAEFNTGRVRMSKATRMEIVEKSGVSYTNIGKNIKRLIDIGILTQHDGDYVINPEVFWKGTFSKREEQLRTEDGVVFNITFYSDDEEDLVTQD